MIQRTVNVEESNLQAVDSGLLSKDSLMVPIVAILGVCLGAVILLVGRFPNKWIFVLAAGGCFPLLVVALGSLEKALVALLIFSLSMVMDVYPWFSDKYATLQPGMPITLTSLLLLSLYTHWLFNPLRGARSIHLFPWVTIPFGVLVLWSGLSFAVAAKPSYVLPMFPRALEAFFIFFYTANFLRSEEDIHFVIKCLAATIAVTAVVGISQYVAGSSFNLQFLGGIEHQLEQQYYAATISRVSGFLWHANNLGFFLAGWLPLFLVCGIGIGRFGLRLLCLLAFALGFVALVLTYSRGGWLGFSFSVIFIGAPLMAKQVRRHFRGAFVRVVFLALAAALLILPFVPNIVMRLTKEDYGAASSRIPMAKTGLKIIHKNPWAGVGLGNYRFVVPDYDPHPIMAPDGKPEPVHNIYLHTAAELGIPALSVFIWLSVAFFAAGFRALRTADKTTALFALGLMAGLAGVYLHGMLELGTLGSPRFVVLSFMGGLLVALGHFGN